MHSPRPFLSLAFVVFLASLAPLASTADSSDLLTPADVAKLRRVSSASVSPSGRHIAYTVSVPRLLGEEDNGPAWTELWVFDVKAAERKPFVTGRVNLSAVQWTPDGRHIGFLAKRGEDEQRSLYLIPIDGGEAQRAASLPGGIVSYDFAPDGERVAALGPGAEDKARKERAEKGFNQKIYEEDWQSTRVWILGLYAENRDPKPLAVPGSVRGVRWHPQEDRLLMAVTPTPSVDDGYMRRRLRIVDATSGEVLRSIENPGKLGQFEWSPNGRFIAFVSAADIHDPSEGRLMVVRAAKGEPRDLLPGWEGHADALAWVDSRTVLYLGNQGTRTIVGEVSVGGRETENARLHGPARPVFGSLSLARRGQTVALTGSSATHPAELFTLERRTRQLQRRTDSNPWLANKRFARQEVIRHAARDGLELEGILIHPLDEEPGERYPLILAVHGGPESHVSDGWLTGYSRPGQVAAARGMAVFYPNYRGSTGRGVEFSKLGQGDPAGKEFDDLVDAVDHLIEIGLVDREKVGVTGGSYGGYATGWCCTRYSDRFAAGVMFVGISDKVSKVGTTDIPDEEYYVHALERPWEMWDLLRERSPIFHADKARTPLLILHGEDDPRVNVGQSMELYRYVKLHGNAPVRLVLYPGEGHGNRKAGARFDYNLRLLRWMEHYLKGPGGEMPVMDLDYAPFHSSSDPR